jgi:hypothetical protein
MLIRPELQALRGDYAPQPLAQHRLAEVTRRWRDHSGASVAAAELARFAAGAELEELPFLSALFAPGDPSAAEFVAGLVAVQTAQLAARPLSQVPMRHYCDDVVSSLIISRHGSANLVLQAIDGTGLARKPEPEAVNFSPSETWEQVMAGEAEVERVLLEGQRPGGAELRREAIRLLPGMVCHRFGHSEAQMLRRIPGSLVTLKLQRRIGSDDVVRQYSLTDGSQIHQSAASPRDSRLELTAALLGRMGRGDAAPLLGAMAEEQAASPLRWQALRECLALDTATGFATLCRLAARSDDPLAAPAGALRAQLLESYPQLGALQDGARSCPV